LVSAKSLRSEARSVSGRATNFAIGPARSVPQRAGFTPRFASPAVARYVPVKAVGTFVPALTRKAFEKYGFAAATLVTDWPQIAGADLASYSVPERLKWPRSPANAEAASADGEGRPGGTLMLRVDPARALDVEYRSRQIVERINAYFGYRAVAELRLIQAPVEAREKPQPTASRAGAPGPGQSADPLAEALARLEKRVLGKEPTRR